MSPRFVSVLMLVPKSTAIADPKGSILEEFDISHTGAGFRDFFRRIEQHKQELDLLVAVAMEGFNGYARPLDRMIQQHGYTLYNVNNLKLAPWNKSIPCIPRGKPGSRKCCLERQREIQLTPVRSLSCSTSKTTCR